MRLPELYPRQHYQHKAARYSSAVRYVFAADVDATTEQRWADLIGLGRAIDTYLDSAPVEDVQRRSQDIRDLLAEPDLVGQQFAALSPDRLDAATYQRLRCLGETVLTAGIGFKTAETVSEYVYHRRAEGLAYAELITGVATPSVAAQPGYDRFRRWLRPVGEVTNLTNSVMDIHSDARRGEISLRPDRLTRIKLLGHIGLILAQAPRATALAS